MPVVSSNKKNPRGDTTRTALLDAGRRLFARRGYDGTSVRDIAREASANLGAVTYHFGSKRGLYEAVLKEGLTPVVDSVGEAAHGEGTPMERLEAVIEVFFAYMLTHPELPRLLLQEVTAGKQPPAEIVKILRRNLSYIGSILADGWKDGSIRSGHPVLTSISVVSQPVYLSVMSPMLREVGGFDLAKPDLRRFATEHVKAFVRAGLEPREEENGS
jgi:AcrR family transcriptional regulator